MCDLYTKQSTPTIPLILTTLVRPVKKTPPDPELQASPHSWRLAVICPNPALDITAVTPVIGPGTSIAGADTTIRAGGKGTNVACVASDLGASTTLVTLLGGDAGASFDHLLDPRLALERVAVTGSTRLCLTLVSPAGVSEVRGRGPAVGNREWDAFTKAARQSAATADAVVISGSFPPGIPARSVDDLVSSLDCPRVYVDTSGEHLAVAAKLADLTIAPNFDELCALTDSDPELLSLDPAGRSRHAARMVEQIQQSGGARVLATLGNAGAGLMISGRWHVAVAPEIQGSPVGAGDAALAAFVATETRGLPAVTALRRAVAAGAAAVTEPLAGRVQPEVVDSLESRVKLLDPDADQVHIAAN